MVLKSFITCRSASSSSSAPGPGDLSALGSALLPGTSTGAYAEHLLTGGRSRATGGHTEGRGWARGSAAEGRRLGRARKAASGRRLRLGRGAAKVEGARWRGRRPLATKLKDAGARLRSDGGCSKRRG